MTSLGKARRFVRPALRPNSDINVTPLVDVVLVLLIIFMVVTPLLEKDINVRVPDTTKVDTPDEVPPDQLVVVITPEGDFLLNSEKISQEEYTNRLKRVLAAKPPGDRLVFFMPDEKANYAKVIAALDGAKMAGAETLGMMTELTPMAPAPPGQPGMPLPATPSSPPPGTPSSTTPAR